jgi:hypothetical protein
MAGLPAILSELTTSLSINSRIYLQRILAATVEGDWGLYGQVVNVPPAT